MPDPREMIRTIEVVPYNPIWPDFFKKESTLLSALLKDQLISIHHIGSTAVPHLCAKPIIDIMPVVKDISKVDDYNDAMASLGYEAMGEYGIPNRRYFYKGGIIHRTHHVHVYQIGNSEIERYIRFRDYLITHPEAAASYAALKTELAQRFRHDIVNYVDGKAEFVKSIDRKASAD